MTTSPTAARAQLVGQRGDRADLGAARAEQRDDLVFARLLPRPDAVQHLAHRAVGRAREPGSSDGVHVGAGVPRRRAAPDQLHLGAVAGVGDVARSAAGSTVPGSSRPRPSASERSSTGEAKAFVQPALVGELGVDRQARREHVAGGLGGVAQRVERRPRPLRVDVVGGDRRDPAPVVDAGRQQRAEVVRRGSAAPARARPPAGSAAPAGSRRGARPPGTADGRASRCRAWAGSSGRSPPARGRAGRGCAAIASSASTRSARSSPMPTRMPVVNGIASSPAASSVASRRAGCLSGAPRWHGRSARSDSSIIPCEALTVRSSASSSRDSAPGVGVRQQSGLLQHQLAHRCQVLDRRPVPVLVAATRGRRRTAPPAPRRA